MERACLDSAYGGEGILICRLSALLLLILLISGCDTPNKSLPYALNITEEGLGSLHPDIPFNQVTTSLSGFEFEKLSQISPSQNEMVFLIKRGGKTLAQIVSDPSGKKIAEIQITSALIKNRYDQGLGDPLPASHTLHCKDDICQNENEPSVHYRIDQNTRIIKEITFSRL